MEKKPNQADRQATCPASENFELVPLSLCPRSMKNFLSLCLVRQDCPILLETLLYINKVSNGSFHPGS